MSGDYTHPDGGLFESNIPPRESVTEVDDILGAIIDDRYEILSRIGQGGMGYVYEAADLARGGGSVVVKTLRPELVNDETTATRFTREAMAQAAIDHKNVIVVRGHGVTEDYGAYYVMERLIGQDLGARLKPAEPQLTIDRMLEIAAQVAAALGAAHAKSIVHRDLKPENIFLVEDGEPGLVKVLDFGLARLLDAGNKLTETGVVIGTPRYMAPEQCQGERVDARADVYSFGLVLYEILSGRQPYAGLGTYEILGKKMLDAIVPLTELDPTLDVDPRIEAFVMRCLEKDPARRPLSGAQVVEELVALRAALKHPPPPRAAARVPAASESRRRLDATQPPMSLPRSRAAAPSPALTREPHGGLRSRAGLWWFALAAAAAIAASVAGAMLLREDQQASAAPTPRPPPEAPPARSSGARLATPSPRAATQIVHVRTEPAGATVRHGGRVLGRTPLELSVPDDAADGEEIELSLDGYAPRTIRVSRSVPTAHVRLHPSP